MARGDGRRGHSIAMIFLLNQVFRTATTYGIPPVTAISIAGQILLYLGFIKTPWSDSWDVCISVDKAWFKRDYKRIIFSAFEHGDDWHLYYNMVSFMWKGRELEQRLGPLRFILILVTFTITSSLTYLGLNYLLATIFDDWAYMRSCAVGFSAVIFALKVLCTHDTNRVNSFLGLPVPSKYIFWFELVYISLISPNASFVGHLAGILVGLAYVHGPLKTFISLIEGMLTGRSHSRRFNSSGMTGDSGRMTGNGDSGRMTGDSGRMTGNGDSGRMTGNGDSGRMTGDSGGMTGNGDSGGFDEEEIRRATEESLRDGRPSAPVYPTDDDWSTRWSSSPAYNTRWSGESQSPPYPTYIHPETEDLRRRRMERFSRSNR